MTNANLQLVTVNATGKRYVYKSRDAVRTPTGFVFKVVCWGEVTSYRFPGVTRHSTDKVFLESAVTITTAERSDHLLHALWRQGLQVLQDQGAQVRLSRSGRRAYITDPSKSNK